MAVPKRNGKERKPSWWLSSKGYIQGRVWENGKRVNVKQHRWLMEQHLGRKLLPDEDVHHINGDKTDNRIENLQVISHAEHARLTNNGRTYKSGYKLTLSEEERAARADRMRRMRAAQST